jgi:MoaA/NifB/PqqE/SkfB family radical SAM enzyme
VDYRVTLRFSSDHRLDGLAGKVTIPSVDWWITSRCNLACDFCYGPEPAKDPVSLRENVLDAILLSSAGVVTFCGGEPLLVREIDHYARRLSRGGKRVILNTNGLLLRRHYGDASGFPFHVVGLSIDGSTADVHRAMRGARADLTEVLAAATLVSSLPDVSLKVATVVSAVNRTDLENLARLIRDTIKPAVWRLYEYSSRGPVNHGQDRHRLPEGEFACLAEKAAKLACPVAVMSSDECLTAGCLIVDPQGDVLQPVSDGYQALGNCLRERIDDIWPAASSFAATVTENKRWLSALPGLSM